MSYLSEFLTSLSPDVRRRLPESVKLSSTEQRVLVSHIDAADRLRDARELPSELSMTIAHFDKCASVILSRSYEYISELQRESIFHILAKSGLHENYVHELAKRDRQYRRDAAADDMEQLYHTAVNSYLLFEARIFQEKIWTQICKRYRSVAKSPEAPYLVRIRTMIREIVIHYIKGERDEILAPYEKELLETWRTIKSKKWPESQIVLCRALAQLYTATSRLENVVLWWERALDILIANPTIYPEARYVVRGSLAETYLHLDGLDKALQQCEAVWEENPEIYRRNGQLNLYYFRILLMSGKLRKAEQILKMRFGTMAILGKDLMRPMDATDFSMYYLYTGNTDMALKFISAGLAMSVKVYRGVEAELRFLECVSFALSGDSFYALELIARSLRYFATKKDIRDAELWRSEFRHLRTLLKAVEQHTALRSADRDYYNSLHHCSVDIFNMMQLLCWNKYKSRLPKTSTVDTSKV